MALLVAQHTAERHVRLMFDEFRSDPWWALTLVSFAVGVGLVVAGALLAPTMSTAWASALVLLWLGLLGAQAFPRLLDSLDPVVLTERAAERAAGRLLRAERQGLTRPNDRMAGDAQRGITACATIAHEAFSNEDTDVFDAAVAGLFRVLTAYLRRSPWVLSTDAPVDLAFQRIDVLTESVSRRSQVILMPILIARLRQLGIDGADIARSNPRGNDVVSTRLNMIRFDILAASLRNRTSTAPSFAASTMADVGVALLQVGLPNGVRDHIDRLRTIAAAGLDANADHVTGAAMHGLARIAAALLHPDSSEVMPPSHFHRTCEAIVDVFKRHIKRNDATLQGQTGILGVIGPLAAPSVPALAVAGSRRATEQSGFAPDEFGFGADQLAAGLAELSVADGESGLVRSFAMDCLYSAVVGALAVATLDAESGQRVDRWIEQITSVVFADEQPRRHVLTRAPVTFASVVLLVAYALSEAEPEVAQLLRLRLRASIDQVAVLPAGFERRRLVKALVPAAVVLAAGNETVVLSDLVESLGPDLQAEVAAGYGRRFTPEPPMPGIPLPRYRLDHQSDAAFGLLEAAIAPVAPRRAARRRRATSIGASSAEGDPGSSGGRRERRPTDPPAAEVERRKRTTRGD